LKQFESEVKSKGYSVTIDRSMEAGASPREFRESPRKQWRESSKLLGAILIGEFGALFSTIDGRKVTAYWHEHPRVDLFYKDLEGQNARPLGQQRTSRAGSLQLRLARLAASIAAPPLRPDISRT
jgi:hypothetical protein